MNLNYLVVDIENDVSKESKALGRKAGTPLNNDPIVAIGLKNNKEVWTQYIFPNVLKEFKIDEDIIVGHNLAHDLQWFWHLEDLQDFFKRGGRIWDTSLVEYILTGQEHKYPALRDIAVNKYHCKEREKLMEKYWDDGLVTSQIPMNLVLEDVKNDVLDTESIFLQQYKKAEELNLLPLIELQSDALLATIEMTMNGMFIHPEILRHNKAELEIELIEKEKQLLDIVKQYWR